MSGGRKVGTLTAGIVLVVFGFMFLMSTIFKNIGYNIILSLWPIIFILLGIEVITAYVINKEEKIKYDTGAIFLVIILTLFAIGMAGLQIVIENYQQFKIIF
ncbi:LiaI-LiaF-like domain-containing protein [Clostridium sp. LBM24168]